MMYSTEHWLMQFRPDLWTSIKYEYSLSNRRYHNLVHIDEMLMFVEHHEQCPFDPVDRRAIMWAAIFHDFVYDAKAPKGENEKASMECAAIALGATESINVIKRVQRLIMVTVDHTPDPEDKTACLLVDADLARFADFWDSFVFNNDNIRKEYAHVSDEDWLAGRATVLQHYLDRDPFYYLTPELEGPATLNLVRAIKELKRGG